jgi:hypothetical protein
MDDYYPSDEPRQSRTRQRRRCGCPLYVELRRGEGRAMSTKSSMRTVGPTQTILPERQARRPRSIALGRMTGPRSSCRALRSTAHRRGAKSAARRSPGARMAKTKRARRRTWRPPERVLSSCFGSAVRPASAQSTAAPASPSCPLRRDFLADAAQIRRSSRSSNALSRCRTSSLSRPPVRLRALSAQDIACRHLSPLWHLSRSHPYTDAEI